MAEPSTNTEMVRVPILGENGRISDDYIPESIPQAVTAVGQAAEAAASSANEALQKAAAAEKAASSASSSAEQAKSYASNANTYMTTAESHAGSAATDAAAASKSASDAAASAAAAEVSNQSAAQSSADAMGFRNNAVQYRDQAREAAQAAQGYVTTVQQLEQNATNSATAAQNSATSASASAETATTAASQASTSATNAAASAQTATEKADAVLDHYIESAQATTLEPGSQATAAVADKVLQLGIPKGEKGDTGLGIPEGGSAGQVVKKTADGTEWAYDTGAVYNSEEGLQEMAEDGTNDPIYNFGITQGGMSASMSVMGDSPEVAADYSAASVSYRNAIGADADGPYVDLNLTGKTGGATKYRYVDDPSQFATADGIPTAKAVASAIGGGNVLKGTLGPAPMLSADDAYATKPRKLTVHGATRQNLWVNPSGTAYGITATSNDDGSLTMSGTSTASAYPSAPVSYILRPGTQYTVSMSPAPVSGLRFQVLEQNADGERTYHSLDSTHLNDTFTTKSDTVSCVMRAEVASAGTTVSGTYRVMLNEGSTAEPWCPPGLNSVGDDGSVKVVTAGKNLFTSSKDAFQIQGTNTTNQCVNIGLKTGKIPIGSEVIFSFDYRLSSGSGAATIQQIGPPYRTLGVAYSLLNGDNTWHKKTGSAITLDIADASVNGYQIRLDNVTGLLDIKNFQLELGSTATAYEPPNITTTPIDLQGHTLNALPDGTCDELHIDGGGNVVLEKRVEVAIAPSEAGSWTWSSEYARASFYPANEGADLVDERNGWCDKLPMRERSVDSGNTSYALVSGKLAYAKNPAITDAAMAASIVGGGKYIYPLAEPQTIPLPAVTLPTLPAPTVNVWADAEASGTGYAMDPDVELEYERDVTIAFNNLQAQISATTVREATNG